MSNMLTKVVSGVVREEIDKFLEQKKPMFHASAFENRASIMAQGLIPGSGADLAPPGVYLFRNESGAEQYITDYPMDIWAVNVRGLDLNPDLEDPDEAVFLKDPISPDRMKFIGTWLHGERMRVPVNPNDWSR